MGNIKLVFLDLDGTLLNSQHKVDKETIDIIKRARIEKGVRSVIATGRPLGFARKVSAQAEMSDFVISNNGELVHNLETGEDFYKGGISDQEIITLHKLCKEMGGSFFIAHARERSLHEGLDLVNQIDPEQLMFHTDSIVKETENNPNSIMTCLIGVDKGQEPLLERIKQRVSQMPGLQAQVCYHQNFPYIDIFTENCSKQTGIEIIANKLLIPKKHIMAIGDGGNDLTMLDCAGLPVAMANANEQLKELVHNKGGYITKCDNNNGGIAEAYSKFIFGKDI